MPKGFHLTRPRSTEEIARETLRGLVAEALNLSNSTDPQAWDRIEQIASEIKSVAGIAAEVLRGRGQAPLVAFFGYQHRGCCRG